MDLRTVRTIRSAIEIRASPQIVWQVLTDFSAYPEWNPYVRQVHGTPGEDRRISIISRPLGARPMRLWPVVTRWSPPHELRWRATLISGRLFSGEHGFRLEPLAHDRVRFVHDETFRGLLVPLYSRLRLPSTRRGFEQMNVALRERAEALAQRTKETQPIKTR